MKAFLKSASSISFTFLIMILLLSTKGNAQTTTNYYLKSSATGNPLNLADANNWTTNSTGGAGTSPAATNLANQIFNITRDVTSTVKWSLGSGSKVVVGHPTNSVTYTIPVQGNGQTTNALTGTVDVSANATLEIKNETAPTLGQINGSIIINPTSSATYDFSTISGNITIGQNFTIKSGKVILSNNSSKSLTIGGDLILSGTGQFDFSSYNGNEAGAPASSTINLGGNLTLTGSTATLTTSPANAKNGIIVFSNTQQKNISIATPANVSYVNYTINAASSVKLLSNLILTTYKGTNPVYAGAVVVNGTFDMVDKTLSAGSISGSCSFELTASGKILSSNTTGLAGSFPSSNMTVTYNPSASIEFNGVDQTLNGMPATLGTLNLSGSGNKALGSALSVLNLNFNGAYLVTTSTNLLTILSNGVISGAGSLTGFVKGPLKRFGASSSTPQLTFPVGNLINAVNYYQPAYITFSSTNSNDAFTVQAFGTQHPQANQVGPFAGGISQFEYWDITPTWSAGSLNQTNGVRVELDYSSRSASVKYFESNTSYYRVAHFNGTRWGLSTLTDNDKIVATGNNSAGRVGQNNVKDFSPFTIGSINASALPVTLSSFTAKATTDNKVNLAWVTASESNNKGFRIERKAEGESKFNAIGFVASKADRGNSQLDLAYSFKDMTAPMGSNMYRLVQEDIDGKQTISDVRMVKLNGQSVVSVYPNPSNGAVTISRTNDGKKMNVQILDQSGRVINQYNNILDSNLRLNLPQSGIYQIKLMYPETGEQSIQRIVVQK